MIDKPRLLEDGTHRIPIWKIRCAECECYPGATGILSWHPEKGATFVFEFPDCSSYQLRKFYRNPLGSSGAGSILTLPVTPRWFAETLDGFPVELYGLEDRPQCENHWGTSGVGCMSKVTGSAWFAVVRFSNNDCLSFWNSTPEKSRAFFLGFNTYHWSNEEDIAFWDENIKKVTLRRSLNLSDCGDLAVYEAGWRVNLSDGAWLTYDLDGKVNETTSYPPASYCGFISLLNGRHTPILWRDSFIDCSTLQRVYFGTNRVQLGKFNSIFPNLPFRRFMEPHDVQQFVEQLPALYATYLQVTQVMDLSFVLSPLWSACDSLLTDRFALACVSLERLAEAWKKSPAGKTARRKKQFWNATQSCKIRKALGGIVDAMATETLLEVNQIKVLKNRIANLGQRTNSDQLTAIFDDFRIALSEPEKAVIAHRNSSLHGKPTLRDRDSLSEIDAEVLRFDLLRMAIAKAVLVLLRYRGPYIDYAARLSHCEFPIEYLQNNLTNTGLQT